MNTINTTDRTRFLRKNYDVRRRKFARATLGINEGVLQTVMALSQRAEQLDLTKRIKLVFRLRLLLNYFSFMRSQICQNNRT